MTTKVRNLFHSPRTVLLNHGNDDFLLRGVIVAEDEESLDVRHGTQRVGARKGVVGDEYLAQTAVLLLDFGMVLLYGLEQLLAIIVGQAVNARLAFQEPRGTAFCQEGVVLLGFQGCLPFRLGVGTGTQGSKNGEYVEQAFHFCRTKTLMGVPVSVQFSRILFSRKRR